MHLPADLALAVSIMAGICVLLGWLCANSRRFLSYRIGVVVAIVAAGVLVLEAAWLKDNLLIARILPLADVIAWGDAQTPAVAVLAGMAWALLDGPRQRKALVVGVLVIVGGWRMMEPYIGEKPRLGPPHWHRGVCGQTTTSTCSAAAAATLLWAVQIPSSEAEMTDQCLTHVDGTTMLGLYRGLKLATRGTNWTVAVFTGSAADLQHQPLPVVITIQNPGLPGGLLGIGNRHSVVIYSFADDRDIEIGDPFTASRQRWTLKQLEPAYVSGGVGLVRR